VVLTTRAHESAVHCARVGGARADEALDVCPTWQRHPRGCTPRFGRQTWPTDQYVGDEWLIAGEKFGNGPRGKRIGPGRGCPCSFSFVLFWLFLSLFFSTFLSNLNFNFAFTRLCEPGLFFLKATFDQDIMV
jgi:hypothetical protein